MDNGHDPHHDLAATIRQALQEADDLGLTMVGIHLNQALVDLTDVGVMPADVISTWRTPAGRIAAA